MTQGKTQEVEFDWQRSKRTGFPEAVLAEGKSAAQIDAIVALAASKGERLLITRLSSEQYGQLSADSRSRLSPPDLSNTVWLGPLPISMRPGIGIVTAGTSDLAVAREAAATLVFAGYAAPIIADVGVAGLWRLLDRLEELRGFRALIAVAGMEGALFSVLAGLVAAPVIAVPSSNGYGVARDGLAAMSSALASCAPGVVAVNIDNGFGAAVAAIKMARMAAG